MRQAPRKSTRRAALSGDARQVALTIRIEADAPLTAADCAALAAALHRSFGFPFRVSVEQVERLERSVRGKREEFVSLV